jgi:type VI secretion system secreted protein Hcp
MGIRGNMWVVDSHEKKIEGSCMVFDRKGSIEVLSMSHKISIPADLKTGKITGNRIHSPLSIVKNMDKTTPFFNKACCTGECLREVKIDLYHINPYGSEVCYLSYTLKNSRVIGISPLVSGTEEGFIEDKENIALMYESITWTHHEGNHEYTDSWLVRS